MLQPRICFDRVRLPSFSRGRFDPGRCSRRPFHRQQQAMLRTVSSTCAFRRKLSRSANSRIWSRWTQETTALTTTRHQRSETPKMNRTMRLCLQGTSEAGNRTASASGFVEQARGSRQPYKPTLPMISCLLWNAILRAQASQRMIQAAGSRAVWHLRQAPRCSQSPAQAKACCAQVFGAH